MTYRYEVNENNEVFIFSNEQVEPLIYQPYWPNGELFTAEEANSWGDTKAKSFDPEYQYDAGGSRENPLVLKPTPEEIREWKLNALGLTVEDLKGLLELE